MSPAMLDRERLARVLGMLGSAHDGEALAAARQAEHLRSEARLTWLDILIPALPQPHGQTVADAIACVIDHDEMLTDWEAAFVRSIRRQRYPLSPKQVVVLERLVEKVRGAEARAA